MLGVGLNDNHLLSTSTKHDTRTNQRKHTLFGNIECLGVIRVVVSTPEKLSEYRVVTVRIEASVMLGDAHTRQNARFLHAFGFNVPSREVVPQHCNESFFRLRKRICTVGIMTVNHCDITRNTCMHYTHPNMSSGCDIKSVIRSNMLRGSRTNVGNVTRWRSMPILRVVTGLHDDNVWPVSQRRIYVVTSDLIHT